MSRRCDSLPLWFQSFGIKGLLNSRNNFPFNVTRPCSWLSYRQAVNAKDGGSKKKKKKKKKERKKEGIERKQRRERKVLLTDVTNEEDMFVALSSNQQCSFRCQGGDSDIFIGSIGKVAYSNECII